MTSRILLADDSITIQKVVNLTFADEGIEVVAVSNGELAEKRLSEIKPDLVLADIFMPGKNGYELCDFIKQSAQFRDIPVVLLVGAFEPFNEAEARRVRADAHLTKPFESRTLVETVRKLISQSAKPRTGSLPSMSLREEEAPAPLAFQPAAPDTGFSFELPAVGDDLGVQKSPLLEQTVMTSALDATILSDASPLELDYGALSHTDVAPTGFEMDVDTNGASAEQGKDTGELPESAAEETPWVEHAAPLTESATVEADLLSTPPITLEPAAPAETGGFRVRSTFGSTSADVVLDFDTVPGPERPEPDRVVSLDVELEQEPPVELPSPSVEAEEAGLASQGVALGAAEAEAGFELAAAPFEEAAEEPLGDLLYSAGEAAEFDLVPAAEVVETPAYTVPAEEAVETPAYTVPAEAVETPAYTVAAEEAVETPALTIPAEEAVEPPELAAPAEEAVEPPELAAPAEEAVEPPELAVPAEEADEAPAYEIGVVTTFEELALAEQEEQAAPAPLGAIETEFAAIDVEATAVDESAAVVSPTETGFDFASVASEPRSYPGLSSRTRATEAQAGQAVLELTPAIMDEIVRRVVAQIGDAVVREIAWEVVPDCVERVVEKLTQEGLAKRV
jgi:CheY-like chemotaxis protein